MLKVVIIETVVIAIYMTLWFAAAQAGRRNDVADVAWGTGFIVTALTATVVSDSMTPRGILVLLRAVLWGVRLAVHIYMRNRGKPEDRRYKKWREEWGRHAVIRAFLQVFILQGLLIVIISLPVTFIIASGQNPFGLLDLLGVCIWTTGFAFEAVGDYQL